jgi:2-polyprenyl-3-methyl-5-hydroxy-6-metoxy-1,4-benzoquinol methylase
MYLQQERICGMQNTSVSHWESIFKARPDAEHSWYQPNPEASLTMLKQCGLTTDARVIDVGAGDSKLVDELLERGYRNISVLDISATALDRTKRRLGSRGDHLHWIVSDVLDFEPQERFDAWHDRAAFHFLLTETDVRRYADLVTKAIRPGGCLVIGTFSLKGPKNCSGLEIRQYDSDQLSRVFGDSFILIQSFQDTHITPAGVHQEFVFCRFRRK